jgi:hypothetical protein
MKPLRFPRTNVSVPYVPQEPVTTKTAQKTKVDSGEVFSQGGRILWDADRTSAVQKAQVGSVPAGSVSVLRAQLQPLKEDNTLFFQKHNGPSVHFPLDAQELSGLQTSNAVSPILPEDPRVVVTLDEMFGEMGIPEPTLPGEEGFWDEFEKVLDLQIARKSKKTSPKQFFDVPRIFENFSMEEAAQAVRADFPSHFPSLLVQQFLQEGAKVDPSIIPQTGNDFVRGPVLLSQLIGWSVSKVSPSAFAAKWNQGRPRPEGVAWAVQQGKLEAPAHIREKLETLGMSKAEEFTAYEEGCPRHPSWPAMHSAASSSSLYLAVVMDLSPEQIAEARRLDYAVATSRSLAGVHYESDNLAGLALGEEVVARELPDFLAQFASSPEEAEQIRTATREKIATIREDHNWLTYKPKSPTNPTSRR